MGATHGAEAMSGFEVKYPANVVHHFYGLKRANERRTVAWEFRGSVDTVHVALPQEKWEEVFASALHGVLEVVDPHIYHDHDLITMDEAGVWRELVLPPNEDAPQREA